jgi:hypothetical protein
VPYWNAFVANLEMHGQGNFFDPRLDDANQFPIAAENGFGHVKSQKDLITPKLPGLHAYQLSLKAPKPPTGSFDAEAAARGKALFNGKAQCSSCHVPPTFTEPGQNLHPGSDIGIDNFQADRSPTHMYRTTPLAGLWSHQKAASTTTAGSRTCCRWSGTTTRRSASTSPRRRRTTSCSTCCRCRSAGISARTPGRATATVDRARQPVHGAVVPVAEHPEDQEVAVKPLWSVWPWSAAAVPSGSSDGRPR